MRSHGDEASFSDRLYQRLEQRSKINNHSAQIIIHNHLNPNNLSTTSEQDAQALKELKEQLTQLLAQQMQDLLQQVQEQANTEKLVLENERQKEIIRNLLLEKNQILAESVDREHIIERQAVDLKQESKENTELKSEVTDKNAMISSQGATIQGLTDDNLELADRVKGKETTIRELTSTINIQEATIHEQADTILGVKTKLVLKDKEMEGLQERLGETKERVEDLRDQVKDLKQDKVIFVNDKRILQEEKQLIIEEKNHYYQITVEQANRIAELEQVHCNVLDHVSLMGRSVSPDFVMISGE